MSNLKPGEFYCHGRIVSPPQTSIHPRVHRGRATHPKVNTSDKPNPATRQRVIAAIERHLERHPADGMSRARVAKLKAGAHQ